MDPQLTPEQEEALRRAIEIQNVARAQDEESDDVAEPPDEEPQDDQESSDEESEDLVEGQNDGAEENDVHSGSLTQFRLDSPLFMARAGGPLHVNHIPNVGHLQANPTLAGGFTRLNHVLTEHIADQTMEGGMPIIATPIKTTHGSSTAMTWFSVLTKGLMLIPFAAAIKIDMPLYSKCEACTCPCNSLRCPICGAMNPGILPDIAKWLSVRTIKVFDGSKSLITWNQP